MRLKAPLGTVVLWWTATAQHSQVSNTIEVKIESRHSSAKTGLENDLIRPASHCLQLKTI